MVVLLEGRNDNTPPKSQCGKPEIHHSRPRGRIVAFSYNDYWHPFWSVVPAPFPAVFDPASMPRPNWACPLASGSSSIFFVVLSLDSFHASGPPHRRLKGKIPFQIAPPEAKSLPQVAYEGAIIVELEAGEGVLSGFGT